MQTSLPKNNISVVSNFCENKVVNESWLSEFHFPVWICVFELALFCTSSFQVLTAVFDVVLMSKIISQLNQRFALNFSLFWNWLVDCWTFAQKTLLQLGNMKHYLMWVRNRMVIAFFQKTLILANVNITLHCCNCAVWAGARWQHLISILLECLNSKLLTSISWIRRFFSENLVCVDA